MLRNSVRAIAGATLGLLFGAPAGAASTAAAHDPAALNRLQAEVGSASVSLDPATGAARFVRVKPAAAASTAGAAPASPLLRPSAQSMKDSATAFINRHGRALGLTSGAAELTLRGSTTDRLGHSHLTYSQEYAGLHVFGAMLKAHFDANGDLTVVNGTLIPDIAVSSAPSRSAREAEATAVRSVGGKKVSARNSRLLVFREGLAKGVPGPDHLAYEVEVGDGARVREFVYVDAHTGKIIDRISGIYDALNRRAYDGENLPTVPPTYPDSPVWVEGQAFPTGIVEADNMILASKETYNFYRNAFGRDSFDGAGATMDAIFNRGYACPNASWNGTFISFCPGLTVDDVTAHEWSHAYTEYTDGLIYQWQPGALNESYSDIFGETVDRINHRGTDTPNNPRTPESCSVFGGSPPPALTVSGGSAAGSYPGLTSANEPTAPFTVGPAALEIASPVDACTPLAPLNGKIAVIDFTLNPDGSSQCGSGTRAANAIAAGAAGIVFVAPPSGLLLLASDPAIGSIELTNADGAAVKSGLPANGSFTVGVGTDNSVRWLLGEDDYAPDLTGALRDMWNPRCFSNPGKVSDKFEYACSTDDQGGVHTNSGIPNHAYALVVDGGSYNGHTMKGLGLTKAAHIYFRAKVTYQGPTTDFSDHADAIEQSCRDLIGANLASLTDGSASGQFISPADCKQVHEAMLAVEMRNPPTQCDFKPLLAKSPPALCPRGSETQDLFRERFDSGKPLREHWRASHSGTTADFTARDWTVASHLPGNRPGRALFGPDPDIGTCGPGGDETAVLHVDSESITVPSKARTTWLAFDHWVATESGWDGGNLKISVNGRAWQIVKAGDFVYNPYNATLYTADDGNTNPIAGEPAFTGSDGGQVEGSWGRSIINLAPYAKPRDRIRLRFDIGNDACGGQFGWYVDDVRVYQCEANHH
ncbi:MAG: M4 family metallopeptidase [Steroidobacteraceae bacterium]